MQSLISNHSESCRLRVQTCICPPVMRIHQSRFRVNLFYGLARDMLFCRICSCDYCAWTVMPLM